MTDISLLLHSYTSVHHHRQSDTHRMWSLVAIHSLKIFM